MGCCAIMEGGLGSEMTMIIFKPVCLYGCRLLLCRVEGLCGNLSIGLVLLVWNYMLRIIYSLEFLIDVQVLP